MGSQLSLLPFVPAVPNAMEVGWKEIKGASKISNIKLVFGLEQSRIEQCRSGDVADALSCHHALFCPPNFPETEVLNCEVGYKFCLYAGIRAGDSGNQLCR